MPNLEVTEEEFQIVRGALAAYNDLYQLWAKDEDEGIGALYRQKGDEIWAVRSKLIDQAWAQRDAAKGPVE